MKVTGGQSIELSIVTKKGTFGVKATPLKGLYMTGGDVASLGVVGAMTSGMLTAATIDPRLYRQLL